MIRKSLLTLIASAVASAALSGQILHIQQFDYDADKNGNTFTDTNFPDEGWSSGTGVITYQHGAGLTYPGLNPAATGGAMVYDWDEVQVYAVPEPSTYAALFGLLALGFVAWRRRR